MTPVAFKYPSKVQGYVEGYACPTCSSIVLISPAMPPAAACVAAKVHCFKCRCGAMAAPGQEECFNCSLEHRIVEALSIDAYDSVVFWPDVGFFSSVDALLDHCESKSLDAPARVWTCRPRYAVAGDGFPVGWDVDYSRCVVLDQDLSPA